MTQGGLYQIDRGASAQGMGGMGMAQPMRGNRSLYASPFRGSLDDSFHLGRVEGLKVLFAQDVHGPLHPDLKSNQGDYRRSLELILSLDADILCEGHYGVYKGRKKVADFIRRF